MTRRSMRCIATVTGLLVAVAASASLADEVSFAGKRVEMFIGSSAGGGTDLSSRLFGDFIVKHLPGQPAIVYRNLPGGQGVKALNHFATRVKPDGLAIAGGSVGHIDQGSRKQSAIEYDPLTFAYIGGISRGGTLLVMRKSAAARLNDPAAKSVVVPAVELVSTGPQMALLGKEYLGWNVRLAIGYSGTPAMILAARQGEVDAMASSSASQLKPLFEDPEFVPYTQLGDLDDVGNFVERANFRDVPLFGPMMEAKLPQDKRAVFSAWLRTQYLDKWFALPPKTPPAYVAAYRVAFNKAVNDPNFVRQARLQFGDDFKAVSADNITQLVEGMVSSADLVLNEMLELRRKHGLPTE